MELLNFTGVRVGHWPVSLDCGPICGHVSDGMSASFSTYKMGDGSYDHLDHVEIRYKDGYMALFLFRYHQEEIENDWWADAEIMWRWPQEEKDGQAQEG